MTVDLTMGQDPKVADWLLEPDGKEKNLHAMVREMILQVDHILICKR
jgi:hypothetical protein